MNTTDRTGPGAGERVEDFPGEARSARAARRLVESALDSWDLAGLSDDATVIISELVTNAVRHTGTSRIRVSVDRIGDQRVRLGVADGSRIVPCLGTLGPEVPHGRGLPLVDALSDRWGTDRWETGHGPWAKRVWAELGEGDEQ